MSDTPIVVPIPGGSAKLRNPSDLPERYRRPLKIITTALGGERLQQIMDAAEGPEESVNDVAEKIGLDEREIELLLRMTDASIYALLDSWTLPLPIPTSVAAVQDMPGPVYDALSEQTAKHAAALMTGPGTEVTPAGDVVDTFTVDAIEDPASPTGASAA